MLQKHVSDLTVDELKTLVRETVEQTLNEYLIDPDKSFILHKSMKSSVRKSTRSIRQGAVLFPAKVVANDLELE